MTAPVYIIKTPCHDIDGALPWEAILKLTRKSRNKRREHWLVHHEPSRWISRWTTVERRRPWAVYHCASWSSLTFAWSRHASLELALAAIAKAQRNS